VKRLCILLQLRINLSGETVTTPTVQELLQRITINPDICHGKPVIRNLRYPVENMLELLSAGMTIDELLADYPDLQREDLLACMAFAQQVMSIKSVYRVAV
jgi:uncharacterized protein (DUF433 family)